MTALQDEETQKKGIVMIIYNVSENWTKYFDPKALKKVAQLRQVMPTKLASMHYCYLDPAFGAVINLIVRTVQRNIRTRTKLHSGTSGGYEYAFFPILQLDTHDIIIYSILRISS